MNWDDLRIFLAVARHRTLAAAGQRLALDATTVARRLARLEKSLAATLFEHRASGHILTPRGQALLEQAQAMESAALAGTAPHGAGLQQGEGTIRLSVSEGFGHWVIAPKLSDFCALYPNINVELVASSGFLNPSRREADMSIMLARPKKGPLVVRKLTDYQLGLYGQHDSPAITNPAELKSARLIGYIPDLIYAPELRYLHEVDSDLEPQLTSTSITAQSLLIESGAGMGILPCFIGDSNARLQRHLPDSIAIQRSFWLVMHRDMQKLARIRLFIDWLTQVVRDNPHILGHKG